jgi:hypothetical protein
MLEIEMYELPTENSSVKEIEAKYCELSKKYREGQHLDDIEIVWMDCANNWLDLK